MRTLTVFAVLVAVIALTLSLSSCSVKTSGEVNAGSTDTAAKPDAAAQTEATPPTEATSGVKVVSLIAGDEFDAEAKKITNETTTFGVDTPEIFVNAGVTGLKTGAKITGTIAAIEVTLSDGTVVKDKELKSIDVTAPGEEATARFSFTPPDKGWPVGTYAVKVSVDGAEVDTVDLTVEKPAG